MATFTWLALLSAQVHLSSLQTPTSKMFLGDAQNFYICSPALHVSAESLLCVGAATSIYILVFRLCSCFSRRSLLWPRCCLPVLPNIQSPGSLCFLHSLQSRSLDIVHVQRRTHLFPQGSNLVIEAILGTGLHVLVLSFRFLNSKLSSGFRSLLQTDT